MNTDTTNISDLPSQNISNQQPMQQSMQQNYNENIVLTQEPQIQQQQIQQQQMQQQQMQQQQMQQSQSNNMLGQKETITIENAEQLGLTNLEQRKVRFDPTQITTDGQTQVDYIPNENVDDYVNNNISNNDVNNRNKKTNNKLTSISNIYDDIQGPLLVVILYFIFQLPNTRTFISKIFPSFFGVDSNIKLNGLICISLIFGLFYYLLNYVIDIMSIY